MSGTEDAQLINYLKATRYKVVCCSTSAREAFNTADLFSKSV
jgi:hypothetical protein